MSKAIAQRMTMESQNTAMDAVRIMLCILCCSALIFARSPLPF
ncbi:MAG: hypothetical protein R3E02_03530 [Blastomonas sp.]